MTRAWNAPQSCPCFTASISFLANALALNNGGAHPCATVVNILTRQTIEDGYSASSRTNTESSFHCTQPNLQKRDRETRRNEPVHIIRVLEDSLDVAEIKERLEWKSPNAFGGAAAIEVSDVAGFAMCGKCGSTASAGAGRYS